MYIVYMKAKSTIMHSRLLVVNGIRTTKIPFKDVTVCKVIVIRWTSQHGRLNGIIT